MDLVALKTDCTNRFLGGESDPVALAASMNALTSSLPSGKPVNERTLTALIGLPATAAVLAALTTASGSGMTLGGTAYPAGMFSLILSMLGNLGTTSDAGGMDTADLQFATFVAMFVAAGVLTTDQAAALTAYSVITVNYCQHTYGRLLDHADISAAFST